MYKIKITIIYSLQILKSLVSLRDSTASNTVFESKQTTIIYLFIKFFFNVILHFNKYYIYFKSTILHIVGLIFSLYLGDSFVSNGAKS